MLMRAQLAWFIVIFIWFPELLYGLYPYGFKSYFMWKCWKYENVKMWKCENVENVENVKMWKCGNMKMRECVTFTAILNIFAVHLFIYSYKRMWKCHVSLIFTTFIRICFLHSLFFSFFVYCLVFLARRYFQCSKILYRNNVARLYYIHEDM